MTTVSSEDVMEDKIFLVTEEQPLNEYEGMLWDEEFVFDQIRSDAESKIGSLNQAQKYTENETLIEHFNQTILLLEEFVSEETYESYVEAIKRVVVLNYVINEL